MCPWLMEFAKLIHIVLQGLWEEEHLNKLNSVCLMEIREHSTRKENAHPLSKLGKSEQAIKQDAKCKGTPWHCEKTLRRVLLSLGKYSQLFTFPPHILLCCSLIPKLMTWFFFSLKLYTQHLQKKVLFKNFANVLRNFKKWLIICSSDEESSTYMFALAPIYSFWQSIHIINLTSRSLTEGTRQPWNIARGCGGSCSIENCSVPEMGFSALRPWRDIWRYFQRHLDIT